MSKDKAAAEAARRIEYVPLSDLKADPRNPKNHSLETIDASIGRFGLVDTIVKDGRTGYIISGHGRTKVLQAMKERGENPPEGVRVTPDGDWEVPVLSGWSSRTDSEAAAALIAMNRTTELGGWVDEALLDLLDDLAQGEGGFEGVGFSEADRRALGALLSSPEDVAPLDDEDFDDLIGEGGMGSKETLTITGLSNSLIQRFRALEGEDDAARFRYLMGLVEEDDEGEVG